MKRGWWIYVLSPKFHIFSCQRISDVYVRCYANYLLVSGSINVRQGSSNRSVLHLRFIYEKQLDFELMQEMYARFNFDQRKYMCCWNFKVGSLVFITIIAFNWKNFQNIFRTGTLAMNFNWNYNISTKQITDKITN